MAAGGSAVVKLPVSPGVIRGGGRG